MQKEEREGRIAVEMSIGEGGVALVRLRCRMCAGTCVAPSADGLAVMQCRDCGGEGTMTHATTDPEFHLAWTEYCYSPGVSSDMRALLREALMTTEALAEAACRCAG